MTTTLQVIETSEIAVEKIQAIKNRLQSSPTGVSFFGVKEYTNKNNETSNYTINIGVDYNAAKKKDIDFLSKLDVTTLTGLKSNNINLELARIALLDSLKKEAGETAQSAAQIEAYETIAPNVKRHLENGKLYIFGMLVNKKILVKGEYKSVNSRDLTIAKDELKKNLKTAKFRMFILDLYTLNYEIVFDAINVDTEVYGLPTETAE